MPQASSTVTVNRPVAEVFAFIADRDNDRKWRGGILELSRTGGQGAGETWHQVIGGPGGRKIPADFEITAFEPQRRVAFRTTTGPVRPEGSYETTADGDGTRLTFSISAELGGIKKLVMGSMVQKSMDSTVAALAKVKEILEGTPGAA